MDRVKNMMKKLIEQKDKANEKITELEGELEEMKLKLEEVRTILIPNLLAGLLLEEVFTMLTC